MEIEKEQDFNKITMRLYSNGIMNVIFKDNFFVELEDVEEVVRWVGELGEHRKYVNLMEAGSNTDVDTDVREFSASDNQNKYTIADAIVINSQAHKILTNFYLRFNKPVKPTRIFTDREKAIQWLLQQRELYYKNS